MIPEKIYNILKYIQRIGLPAVIVLLGSIGTAIQWDATIVIAIISAVDVFMGSLLQIDQHVYNKNNN